MEDVHSQTNASGPVPLPPGAEWKLGESLALSHLSALPELPQTNSTEDCRLQQLQYAMHLDSAMLNFTPAAGVLKNGESQQAASRFDDNKAIKRKIFVNKDVLGRLVSVAEELNKAQAQIEVRKMLKREQRALVEQQQLQSRELDPAVVSELMSGLHVEGQQQPEEEAAAAAASVWGAAKKAGGRGAPRRDAPSVYRNSQARYPAVLSSIAPKDRWGYFRAMQRLMPAANCGRPGRVAFGSTAPAAAGGGRPRQRVMGAAAVKAAKQLQLEIERQAEAEAAAAMTECGEDDGGGGEAAAGGGAASSDACGHSVVSSGGGESVALANLDATVQAVMHAAQVREARRAAARQLAEDEGLPTETWWDIMQKRKKLVYFKKLLEEMTDRMGLIKLHRAARVIQKAWRTHRRARTRNASEEIALLQKELAHRKAMEVALRAAAEAALLDQQERAKKRAARIAARLAAFHAMQAAQQAAQQQQAARQSQSGAASDGHGKGSGKGTFSRATSQKNLGWQFSLRGSMTSPARSRAASRAASGRRPQAAAEGQDGAADGQQGYQAEQNSLWFKIQALIGADWDVDDEEDSDADEEGEDEEEEEEEEDGEEGADGEEEAERRARMRRQRNEARRARKAAADAAAEAAAAAGDGSGGGRRRKKKRRKGRRGGGSGGGGGGGGLPPASMLVRVVKEAMAAAKAMQADDDKNGGGKRRRGRHRNRNRKGGTGGADPANSMRMLAAAAAALNMTVEAYVAMRNRKLGVTALSPWQPPPFPMLVEADGEQMALEEHELRELEEEARQELLEKAAMEFVTAATAAAAAAASPSCGSSAVGRTGSTTSASASLFADSASISTWGGSATAALAAAAAGADGGSAAALLQPLTPYDSAAEAAEAFAAAAAPSLTIPEDDVWALVKEKLRLRMASRAGPANGAMSPGGYGRGGTSAGGGAMSTAGATVASGRISFFTSDSESYDDSDYDNSEYDIEESSEYDSGETRRRRRRRQCSPGGTSDRKVGGGGGRRQGGGGNSGAPSPLRPVVRSSDAGYETMSEDEIRAAPPDTLLKIQRQKERSRKRLRGYYVDRRRAKRAAAAAAAAALRAERAAARAARRDAMVRLRHGAMIGPAWRPGGGGDAAAKRRAAAAAAAVAAEAGAEVSPMRFWRPPPPRRPRRSPRPLRGGAASGDDDDDDGGSASSAVPKTPPVRLGPYNLSPGGPSLLYRPPKSREKKAVRHSASVRAATWLKGAEVPGAVFTQFGWVPARPGPAAGGVVVGIDGRPSLTLQLELLPEPALLPALEAYVRHLGIPREGLGSPKVSLGSNGSPAQHRPTGHAAPATPSHARMQPLMVHSLGPHAAAGAGDGPRATSPLVRPPPAPNSVAAIFGATSAGFFVSHAPMVPYPPPAALNARTAMAVPPPAVTRGTVSPVCTVGTARGEAEAGAAPGLGPWGGGGGAGIPAVMGRALSSSTSSFPAFSPASSSRALFGRARSQGADGPSPPPRQQLERVGTPTGGRTFMTSRRSLSPPPLGEDSGPGGGVTQVMGSTMSMTARGGASRGARSAASGGSGAAAAAAAAVNGDHSDGGNGGRASLVDEDAPGHVGDGSGGSGWGAEREAPPIPQQQSEDAPALSGEPFQVAMAVLRSKSAKPGVAERVFPQGRARLADPDSDLASPRRDGYGDEDGDGEGPMSYPLDDINSSSDSDSDSNGGGGGADADGWATASDGDCGVSGGAEREQAVASAPAGAADDEEEKYGTDVGDAGGGGGAVRLTLMQRLRGGGGGAAPAVGQGAPTAVEGHALREPPVAAAAAAVRPVHHAAGMKAAAPVTAATGRAAQRMARTRTLPPPLIIPAAGAFAAGGAAAVAATAAAMATTPTGEGLTDGEPLQDEDGARQFDVLYNMTRWAVAPPPTPTNYRVKDDHVAVTLHRSKKAKQRQQEEAHEERRARLLAMYGGAGAAAVYGGAAYERVLYRRRHARALAALAASQSPIARLLRALAFDVEIASASLSPQRAGGGGDSVVATPAVCSGGGDGVAASKRGSRPVAGATSGGGFRRMRRGGGGGGGRFLAGGVVHEEANRGIIWVPSRSGRTQMRVRPGGGCTSGFGNTYYWRQPVRLASLIQVRPAGAVAAAAGRGSNGGGGAAAVADEGGDGDGDGGLAPEMAMTAMTNTAIQLLSELGSEIGRMEEEIEVLKRRQEREQRRREAAAAAAATLAPTGTTATAAPPPPRSPPYRTRHLTFHHHLHLQAQPPQALTQSQLAGGQRPASRSRLAHPPSQKLVMMALDPPTIIQGVSVPRLPHPQRSTSPMLQPSSHQAQGCPGPLAGAFVGRGGRGRGPYGGTSAFGGPARRAAEQQTQPGLSGGGCNGDTGGGGVPNSSHSAPLTRTSGPPAAPQGSGFGLSPGSEPFSPPLHKISSIASGSGSSVRSDSPEVVPFETVTPPGHPLPLPAGGGGAAAAAGGPVGRRPVANPALVPTPHNTLSSNVGWPSSRASSVSGAPATPDLAPVTTRTATAAPPSPVAVWASPRRSMTGAEPAVSGSGGGGGSSWDPPAATTLAARSPGLALAPALPLPHFARGGASPHPRNNSPPTLLPRISTTVGGGSNSGGIAPPPPPASEGLPYGTASASRLGHAGGILAAGSAAAAVAAAAAAGAAAAGVPAPSSLPLAAWATGPLPGSTLLPEISQGSLSPRLNSTITNAYGMQVMRSSLSCSMGSGAGGGAAASGGLMRTLTPFLGSTGGGGGVSGGPRTAASPPHSPLRNYPRMELGLGAGSSPYRIRRGSSNGPGAAYYSYTVGGAGAGGFHSNQHASSFVDTFENGPGAVSVDRLLLNMALFGGGSAAAGSAGGLDRTAAQRASAAALGSGPRRPRASDAASAMATTTTTPPPPLTSTVSALTVMATPASTEAPAGGVARTGRVRRLSIGPMSGGSGGGTAVMAMAAP